MKENLPKYVQRGIGLRKCASEHGATVHEYETGLYRVWKSGFCVKYSAFTSTASIMAEYRPNLEPMSVVSWLLFTIEENQHGSTVV